MCAPYLSYGGTDAEHERTMHSLRAQVHKARHQRLHLAYIGSAHVRSADVVVKMHVQRRSPFTERRLHSVANSRGIKFRSNSMILDVLIISDRYVLVGEEQE